MKSPAKAYSLFIAILFLVSGHLKAESGEPKIEKKKTYSKSYPVGSRDNISLDNQFGSLVISTWDKNEVKVDITMTGKGNTDQIAQEILDRISIKDGKSASGVYFKTEIGNSGKNWGKGDKYKNTGFSIDYVVYLPAENPLEVKNQFGPITLGNYNGEISIESKFGSLTAGKLGNPRKIWVEFGKASIAGMNSGNLTVKFSNAEVQSLTGSVKASFEFCGGVKLAVNNELKDLTVKNNYTQLYLDASTNLSASFDIYTNFSELKNSSNFTISEEDRDEDHGPKFDHQYNGKSGSGNTQIKVKSDFGNVTLGHNLPFDINKENKEGKKGKAV